MTLRRGRSLLCPTCSGPAVLARSPPRCCECLAVCILLSSSTHARTDLLWLEGSAAQIPHPPCCSICWLRRSQLRGFLLASEVCYCLLSFWVVLPCSRTFPNSLPAHAFTFATLLLLWDLCRGWPCEGLGCSGKQCSSRGWQRYSGSQLDLQRHKLGSWESSELIPTRARWRGQSAGDVPWLVAGPRSPQRDVAAGAWP